MGRPVQTLINLTWTDPGEETVGWGGVGQTGTFQSSEVADVRTAAEGETLVRQRKLANDV